MDAFLAGAAQVFALDTLIYMAIGSVAGIFAASIPGFTITMAIVLTLPLTFAMEPLQGIAVMLSVYVGGYSGGLISAALLGIPGTPSSVATTFDAFPMARSGEPGRALLMGVWARRGGLRKPRNALEAAHRKVWLHPSRVTPPRPAAA